MSLHNCPSMECAARHIREARRLYLPGNDDLTVWTPHLVEYVGRHRKPAED